MIHKIKLMEAFADAVLSGEKNFEIRLNDRGYQKGDYVRFIVTTSGGMKRISHPVDERLFVITYVLNGFGLEANYCVFGIRPCLENEGVVE